MTRKGAILALIVIVAFFYFGGSSLGILPGPGPSSGTSGTDGTISIQNGQCQVLVNDVMVYGNYTGTTGNTIQSINFTNSAGTVYYRSNLAKDLFGGSLSINGRSQQYQVCVPGNQGYVPFAFFTGPLIPRGETCKMTSVAAQTNGFQAVNLKTVTSGCKAG